MWNKIRKALYEACDILELFMAFVVLVGIIIAIIAVAPEILEFWKHRGEAGAFFEFIELIFAVVIGIEFMKMLCKPSTATIIEALIFLMARHMVVQTTTAGEDLISVISICILFVFRRVMLATKPDGNNHVPNIFHAIKIAQNKEFRDAVSQLEEEEIQEDGKNN